MVNDPIPRQDKVVARGQAGRGLGRAPVGVEPRVPTGGRVMRPGIADGRGGIFLADAGVSARLVNGAGAPAAPAREPEAATATSGGRQGAVR